MIDNLKEILKDTIYIWGPKFSKVTIHDGHWKAMRDEPIK
jgi:hypothetical protein